MCLMDLSLKVAYDSSEDDLIQDFYVPVLSCAIKYYRTTGFFSSTSLALAARGLFPFIKKGGKMKIISSVNINSKDIKAIKDGLVKPEEIIERIILEELENIGEGEKLDRFKLLAWMVANNQLEIRIAVKDMWDIDDIEILLALNEGMFHQKIGIFVDEHNSMISFSGSLNETQGGWYNNIEEFKVFKSWEEGVREYLESDLNKFFSYWENKSSNVKTFSFPEAAKGKIISLAPKDLRELAHLEDSDDHTLDSVGIKLRSYQEEAIEKWFLNGQSGILEMATGTGKTFTAISILRRIQDEKNKLLTIITVPLIHLASQWKRELAKFNIHAIEYHSQSKDPVTLELFNLKHGIIDNLVIIAVHNTFSSPKFVKSISDVNFEVLLIADECHWLGAEQRRKGLLDTYTKRLGLSATPARWLDEEGTNQLLRYFDGIVFSFPLDQAIPKFLTEYNYHPIFVNFTDEELKEFKKITKDIAILADEEIDLKIEQKIGVIRIDRSKIIQNASNKFHLLEELLDSMPSDITHVLAYCSPEQLRHVQDLINNRGYLQHKITQVEKLAQRNLFIKKFAEGEYQFLTAIKCLDEGVDIPATKIAIMLSNSGNPKEFIQRRGRILRKSENKQYATIYDFIVMPPLTEISYSENHKKIEYQFIQKELSRYREFAKLAKNSNDCLHIIDIYEKQVEDEL